MNFLQTFLNVLVVVSCLRSPAAATERVPWLSLWGTAAEFTSECSHWRLKPQVSIPSLQEFTVCFHLQLQNLGSWWTAFAYRHPDNPYTELGLGRNNDRLVVWLFGEKWTAQKVNIKLWRWHSLCVTWSHVKDRPAFYVNGEAVAVFSAPLAESSPSVSSVRRQLAANGSLTLGALHSITDGNIVVHPFDLPGKLSLFRMWGRERSAEEVTSLMCTEGDLVKWKADDWDTQICTLIQDPSLQCDWSSYEVGLTFIIFRYEGNSTELNTARDFAHNWLRSVLPSTFYLHTVSVFELARSDPEDLVQENGPWATPNINRFRSVVHVRVSPSLDVAAVQNKIYADLSVMYKDPGGVLDLLADAGSIYTTPVEGFSPATAIPPTGTPCPATTVTTFMPTSTTTAAPQTPTTSFNTPTSVTSPENISDLYFQVKTNVTMTSDHDPEQTISTWLNSSLPDDLMMVLDLELLPKPDRQSRHPQDSAAAAGSPVKVSRDSCIFQVQVMRPLSHAQEMAEQIRKLLLMPYNDGPVSIVTDDIEIRRILLFTCDSETQQSRKGLFVWPGTAGGRNVTRECPKNPSHLATRHCKLCLSTHWIDPDLEDCPLVVETIGDLDHVKVTSENALDILEMIEDLLRNHTTLNYQELVTVLNKLEDIIKLNVVTRILGQALIDIISDILESDSNLVPFTNTILNITEAVGDKMLSNEGSSTLVAPAFAMSVVDVGPGQFEKLTFGVSSGRTGTNPEIYINKNPFNDTVAFISLPPALQHSFPQHDVNYTPSRVHFQFFSIPLLFMKSQKGLVLNTFVVSASVTNASSPIKDLSEEVQVILHHLIPNRLQREVHCVYWNYDTNHGHGGWDDYGCRKHNSSPEYTTCLCDHLTHFGVLMDISRTPLDPYNEQILTMITYVGCGVSSLFLGVTVLTYIAFDKLRRDYPSQILINLSLALLGLNLVFLINSWLSSWGVYGLCVAVASLLHYFLLASFTWMGLEAVNMYFALVKVFNVYVPSYILKFCALGWGLPLVVCILVLIVNREAYGSHIYTDTEPTFAPLDNSDHFCWIQDNVTFFVSVVAYGALIFLFNVGVFIVVLIQIRRMRANSPAGSQSGLMQDLKGVSSLTLLLGLTWTAGFFTWGPARLVLLYLFAVLNTLQGLFIFLFHCLMKENVRKQWRIHLCFGRFRLDKYSEWSNSASVRVQAKPRTKPPKPRKPSVRSIKSSSTDSTSASSTSSQRDASCKRPDLGLFVNPPALPRAQRSPAGAGAQSSTPGWRNHFT